MPEIQRAADRMMTDSRDAKSLRSHKLKKGIHTRRGLKMDNTKLAPNLVNTLAAYKALKSVSRKRRTDVMGLDTPHGISRKLDRHALSSKRAPATKKRRLARNE